MIKKNHLYLNKAQKLAKKRSGKFLSKIYLTQKTKYKWQCSKNHVWQATYENICRNNSWCPRCAIKKNTLSLGEAKELAKKNKGKCLSKKYQSSRVKLKWQCIKGHVWNTSISSVKSGKWCRECLKLTIEEISFLAKEKNGECLSRKYINSHSKLKFKCSCGYKWKTAANNIKSGKWCPKCAGHLHLTIEEMKRIAKKRNGKCLSKKYYNNNTKLKWKCSENHQWESTPQSIKSGAWCPKCHFFYNEEICRTTFEQIFNKRFKKTRPEWLMGFKGKTLELDGYNKFYQIAFEFQGEQHFKNISFFSNKNLKYNQAKDKLKVSLCKKNGVLLFVISYKFDLIKLPTLIKEKINLKLKIYKTLNFDKEINFNNVYSHKSKINSLIRLAEKNGGKCLSKRYVNNTTNMQWKCNENHTWSAPSARITRGAWCPHCSGNAKLTIKIMQQVAKLRNGKCLSKNYYNNRTRLKWICAKGHTWESSPRSIVNNNTWCRKCNNIVRKEKSKL